MAILLNKISEIEDVREMPNSEIEKYIQLAYKRENNRQILRERIIESKTYRDIIEKHWFCPVGDWSDEKSERVVRAWTNEIQRMETKFYRIVRRNRRYAEKLKQIPAADVRPVVRGTWTRVDYEPCGHDYICSECGCMSDGPWNFCPNCGADMREVKPNGEVAEVLAFSDENQIHGRS
jgi:rubrerythrin